VCIGGVDILELRARTAGARGRLVAYVPQDPQVASTRRYGGQQLREAIIIHGDSLEHETVDQRVTQLMEEVGLPATDAFLNSYPPDVGWSAAARRNRHGISCRPRVIVLDEPTTGLDVTTQRRVLETVRQMTVEHDVTSVYVSTPGVVAQLATDRGALCRSPRRARPTEAIFRGARHPYAVVFSRPSPARPQRNPGRHRRQATTAGRWPQGCSFAERCGSVQDQCREELPALRDLGDVQPHW